MKESIFQLLLRNQDFARFYLPSLLIIGVMREINHLKMVSPPSVHVYKGKCNSQRAINIHVLQCIVTLGNHS